VAIRITDPDTEPNTDPYRDAGKTRLGGGMHYMHCPVLLLVIVTFRVSRRRREMYCGHARLCVCLSAAACPHYYTDPDVTWGNGRGCPPSCALLGGFAIGARVALSWQHNANAKC